MITALAAWPLAAETTPALQPPATAVSIAAVPSIRAEPIEPVEIPQDLDPGVVELGRRLFFEPGLSGDGTISCAHCHDPAGGGDDGEQTSVGVSGLSLGINAPSIYDAGGNLAQFWDGRADTLEAQIDGPLTHPDEMGSTWPEVLGFLRNSKDYRREFGRVFGDGISRANVETAIADYERSLVSSGSRFDLWLRGDNKALTQLELDGYQTFKSIGCITCHQGRNVGGNLFHKMGLIEDHFEGRADEPRHLGRFNVTGDSRDRHVFKVPSLRQVVNTAPYFHDGTAINLRSAIRTMSRVQLGLELSSEQVDSIAAFMGTLSRERHR